jgi:hypothetical protein
MKTNGGFQMAGENTASSEAEAMKGTEDAKLKQRSTIAFPYMALDDAVELAEAIHGNVGLGDCDDDQLAAWTKQSIKSSGFRVQIAAARLFGLITSPSGGTYRLTELGGAVIDPAQAREARANAFLNVPLYRAVFDKYRGGVLPSQAAAMERELVGLGVSEKVKDRARQTFERSAEQAGFFAHGRNRLVMPGIAARAPEAAPPPELPEQPEIKKNGNGDGGLPPGVDPIIAGLLKRLPKSGDVWPKTQRKLWLQLLEGSFDLIYEDEAAN